MKFARTTIAALALVLSISAATGYEITSGPEGGGEIPVVTLTCGIVVDDTNGDPQSGVLVEFAAACGTPITSMTTDSNGYFEHDPGCEQLIRVRLPNVAIGTVLVDSGSELLVTIP